VQSNQTVRKTTGAVFWWRKDAYLV